MPGARPVLATLLAELHAAEIAGDPTYAILIGERTTAAYPDEPAPWFSLCRLLLESRDSRAAALLPRLEQFADFAPGWEDIGAALLAQGKPAAAHVAFTRAIEHGPERPRAHLGRAAAFEAEGRHANAAMALAAAERLLPESWEVSYRRGLSLRQAGAMAAARQALERAVTRPNAGSAAWYALGIVAQDSNDRRTAITAYRKALDLKPEFHEAALNLGAALQDDGDWETALDAYALAYRLEPASFGRIAQAAVAARTGRLFLDPEVLRRSLVSRG